MKRRSPYVSMISDDDDSDIDKITSYCERCDSFGFSNVLLGPRIYPEGGPKPHDSENWLQCYRCGTIVAKVHAKHMNEFGTITDPSENIHDFQKVAILLIHARSKSYDRKRKEIKRIDSVNDSAVEKDIDLQSMISKGKQLVSYNDYPSS